MEPSEHTKDYDRAIKALEMTTLTEINLTEQQFAAWVMDDWSWKAAFTSTFNAYVGAAGKR